MCIVAILVAGLSVNAQDDGSKSSGGEFNVGINLGFPTSDASDFYTFVLGVEINYLFEVSDAFEVGPSLSFVNYFGDEVFGFDIDDASFLPIAAAARFNVSENFVLGADLGYGIGLSPSGNDGGFYYRPMVGFNINSKIMLQATYSGISINDGGTFGNFSIGAMVAL